MLQLASWLVNAHCNLFHKYQNGIFTLYNRRRRRRRGGGGEPHIKNHVFETQSFVRMSQFHRRLVLSFFLHFSRISFSRLRVHVNVYVHAF